MTAVAEAPAGTVAEPRPSPLLHRLRLLAVCLLLTLLAFVQTPGRTAVDTKVDLAVDPLGFLARALRLWDPQAAFGQLQNQATGYLFPMGPFFAIGHLLRLPPWVVQRSWWALLMVVAFLGFVRLAGRMGIGVPWARLLVGVGFAVAPRVTSVLGATSVEALPLCLTPWVLLPLVDVAQGRRSARVGAARSGVAVLCLGGVNAVASLAALPVAGLFVLCSVRGRTRRALAGWWVLAVSLATLWWMVPLVLLGRYSPPFLDYIESSTVTTGVTSLTEALRGTSHWVGFLATGRGPVWPAAWRLVHDPVTVLNTVLLAGLGLLGLSRRDLPYRATLLPAVLLGVALVTAGHVGTVDGALAGGLRSALDGGLAPFRNVHKFDAVLRLPLMLAACHALARLRLPAVQLRSVVVPAERVTGLVAGVVVLGVASPLVLGYAVPGGSWTEIPSWWRQTAHYLAARHADGRALLVPGSSFADYRWGSTGDEPLQALAGSPWAVRNGIPLTPPGTIRLLDGVQERLRHGEGGAGLTETLQRSGVGLLVVRNDLDWSATGAPRPALVHQALADSPGIRRVATFGPAVGSPGDDRFLPDAGLDLPYPAVEVFEVGSGGERLGTYPAATAVRLAGGPEALLAAGDRGLVTGRATTLAGQPPVPGGSGLELVTDTLRRREVPFSSLPGDAATLAADDPFRVRRAAHDYLPVPGKERQTVARTVGARRVLASSSGSDINAQLRPGAQYAPSAAFDGSPDTYWHSAAQHRAVGQWLEVQLAEPTDVSQVEVDLASGTQLSDVEALTVTTDQGSMTSPVAVLGGRQDLPARPGPTTRVRVTVAAVRGGGPGTAAGIRELSVPGVLVSTALVPPAPAAASSATAYLLRQVAGPTYGCVRVGDRPLCTPQLLTPDTVTGPLDRLLEVVHPGGYGVSVTGRPRPGAALDALVDQGRPLRVSASSSAVPDAAARPGSVVDRDLGTGWVAAATDRAPALELSWRGARVVDELQLLVDPALAASRPKSVTVVAGGRRSTATVDPEGKAFFPAVRTERLRVELERTPSRGTSDQRTGAFRALPVGVSELVVPALDDLRRPVDRGAQRTLPCGTGPSAQVGDEVLQTRFSASVGALLSGAPVTTLTCGFGPVALAAGEVRVVARSSDLLDPVSLLLAPAGASARPDGEARSATAGRWDAEHRTVRMGAGPATVLVVHENSNAGWHATLGGARLRSVVVDGWQQGWLVPAGAAGVVRLDYAPGSTYRLGLLLGALAVLLLLVLAAGAPRRPVPAPDAVVQGVPRAVLAVCAGLLVLLGGLAGLVVLVTVGAVVRALESRGRPVATAVTGAAVLAVGAVAASATWPTGRGGQSALAQVLVLVALTAAGAASAAAEPRSGPPG